MLMALATFVFWTGRNKFVHIPPGGLAFVREILSREGLKVLGRLAIIYAFILMFWALFDQQGSAWVLQAQRMDRHFIVDWDPSQAQWLNPALVLIFIPLFNRVVYPMFDGFWPLTPLRKISIGLFLTVPAFLLPAWLEARLDAGETVNIVWQLGCYIIMTRKRRCRKPLHSGGELLHSEPGRIQ